MKQGDLYVIAAPSGAGKTSLVDALVKQTECLEVSVSYTTRQQRAGERDGENYHFIDQTTFKKMVAEGDFLEHAQVFSHYYGTSKSWVIERLRAGQDVILEIDWQGAAQARQWQPTVMTIFILPPSRDALRARLQQRAQDPAEVIAQRMQAADSEMAHYQEFDYLVVNDNFQQAVNELSAIVISHRLRQARQSQQQQQLLAVWHNSDYYSSS